MMTAALVILGLGAVLLALALRRRGSARASDLGTVSESWLAGESAAGPRRY